MLGERGGTRDHNLARQGCAPADLPYLRQVIEDNQIRFLIVDATMAVLPGDVDSFRDRDVLRALHPLAAVANETGAAVVVNRHFTKSSDMKPIHEGAVRQAVAQAFATYDVGLLYADP